MWDGNKKIFFCTTAWDMGLDNPIPPSADRVKPDINSSPKARFSWYPAEVFRTEAG
jgi:hypothetical protein